MMNTTTVPTRRTLIALAIADVVLFVIANVTANSSSSPGTVSNVAWVLCLLGFFSLVVLAVLALAQSRRSRSRAH
jgi:hypothetical protein